MNKNIKALKFDNISEVNMLIEALGQYKAIKGSKMFPNDKIDSLLSTVYEAQRLFQKENI